jgi:hypothetical protein
MKTYAKKIEQNRRCILKENLLVQITSAMSDDELMEKMDRSVKQEWNPEEKHSLKILAAAKKAARRSRIIQSDIATYPTCKTDCHCSNCRPDLFIGGPDEGNLLLDGESEAALKFREGQIRSAFNGDQWIFHKGQWQVGT